MPMRDAGDDALAAWRPAVAPRHVGGRPGFIDEDEPYRVHARLDLAPGCTGLGDIRPRLLGGMLCLFLSVNPSRSSTFHIPPWLTDTPWVARIQARSSSNVASGWTDTRPLIAS